MWKKAYGVGSVIILIFFGLYFWPQIQGTVEEVDFEIPTFTSYTCADGKSLRAGVLKSSAQLLLSDGRIFEVVKLENTEDDVGYRSVDGRIEFWSRDFSAFLTEDGITTFGSCRDSSVEFPEVNIDVATTSEETTEIVNEQS